MNIVSPSVSSNDLVILPRYYEEVSSNLVFLFEDEDTKKPLTHTIDNLVKGDGHLTVSVGADFIDNRSYKLKITDSDLSEIVYRGIVFATDQNPQNYRIDGE